MILKVNDTEKFNISMTLHVDWEDKKINIHIKNYNKQAGVVHSYEYPADAFDKAIAKFDEIEKQKGF